MHFKLLLGSAKPKAVQEAQKLHCVDAAASDAKILSKWYLASLVYIFFQIGTYYIWIFIENFCSKIFWTTLQDVYNIPHTFYEAVEP